VTYPMTTAAVLQQIAAMGCELFEVGVFRPEAPGREASMLLRVWGPDTLLRCVRWLRLENQRDRHIYIRPKGEHNLSLVDDLTADTVAAMKRDGFQPALVVETSPSNFQAWLKHPDRLDKELSTATARTLAEKFGGDTGAADWRHFGRLSGFDNRKPKYQDPITGLYPAVRIVEAEGKVYERADRFLASVRGTIGERLRARERLSQQTYESPVGRQLKTIEMFRSDLRYAGDGNRIDMAYAIYALSHGLAADAVAAAIRSRDLSKKGPEHRQQEYVERTIRKAGARFLEPSRGR
jgi:RepB DNA-primase from phage plasmid